MNALSRAFSDSRAPHDLRGLPQLEQRPRLGSQPLIRTGRLTLRKIRDSDAAAVTAALSDYRVAMMLTRVPQPYHLEDAEDWLRSLDDGGGWIFGVTLGGLRAILAPQMASGIGDNADDPLIGVIAIDWRTSNGRDGWHVGYWLARPHWGQGIMTEALNAVLARFFAAHMGDVLLSSVMAENLASLKLQNKLGFDVTGVGEAYCEARSAMTRMILTEVTFGGYMPR